MTGRSAPTSLRSSLRTQLSRKQKAEQQRGQVPFHDCVTSCLSHRGAHRCISPSSDTALGGWTVTPPGYFWWFGFAKPQEISPSLEPIICLAGVNQKRKTSDLRPQGPRLLAPGGCCSSPPPTPVPSMRCQHLRSRSPTPYEAQAERTWL